MVMFFCGNGPVPGMEQAGKRASSCMFQPVFFCEILWLIILFYCLGNHENLTTETRRHGEEQRLKAEEIRTAEERGTESFLYCRINIHGKASGFHPELYVA